MVFGILVFGICLFTFVCAATFARGLVHTHYLDIVLPATTTCRYHHLPAPWFLLPAFTRPHTHTYTLPRSCLPHHYHPFTTHTHFPSTTTFTILRYHHPTPPAGFVPHHLIPLPHTHHHLYLTFYVVLYHTIYDSGRFYPFGSLVWFVVYLVVVVTFGSNLVYHTTPITDRSFTYIHHYCGWIPLYTIYRTYTHLRGLLFTAVYHLCLPACLTLWFCHLPRTACYTWFLPATVHLDFTLWTHTTYGCCCGSRHVTRLHTHTHTHLV